jgi:hypothetical protein
LYRYTDPDLIPRLKDDFLHSNGSLLREQTRRVYPFDYEFLAEGGVQNYLERLLPFLHIQGVVIDTITQTIDSEGLNYNVSIDGQTHVIYLESEFDKADSWGLTIIRTSILVNNFLRTAGSKETFYLFTGGNNSRLAPFEGEAGAFLTPDLFTAISEAGLAHDTDGREFLSLLDEPFLELLLKKS